MQTTLQKSTLGEISLDAYWSLLLRYLRPHRGKVVVVILLLLGTIGLQLLNPQIVRTFLDAAQAEQSMRTLSLLALFFLGAALLKYLLTPGAYLCQ